MFLMNDSIDKPILIWNDMFLPSEMETVLDNFKFSTGKEIDRDFVKKKFPNQSIALYGFSLSASAMLMSKIKVNAIVSDSAYANLENMVKKIPNISAATTAAAEGG